MKSCSLVIPALLIIISCKQYKKEIHFQNENYLNCTDSVAITLDSSTYPYSSNIYCRDSLLFIQNEESNTISIYTLRGKKILNYDFNVFKQKIKNFSVTAAWPYSVDSIFVYSKPSKKIYLFNHKLILLDSFQMPLDKDYVLNKQYPDPEISTCQQPAYFNGSLFVTGFTIGENLLRNDSNKFVACESNKIGKFFYVNYPEDYYKLDWGGIYYRMVYSCILYDSILCISFPASSSIALFNLKTKSIHYQNMFPDMKEYIEPYSKKKMKKFDKAKIAEHFYGQYSFKGIVYDKYRKLFYRFLLKPTSDKYLQKHHVGPQEQFLLVYDDKFNYLGFNKLDLTYSKFTFFVAEKGLYIQRIKNIKDEEHIFFDVFSVSPNKTM